jgi:hypothetical protein
MSESVPSIEAQLAALTVLVEATDPEQALVVVRVAIQSLICGPVNASSSPLDATSSDWDRLRRNLAAVVLSTPACDRAALAKELGISNSTMRSLIYERGPSPGTQMRIRDWLAARAAGISSPISAPRMNGHKVDPHVLPMALQDRLNIMLVHCKDGDIRRTFGCDPRTARLAADGEALATEIIARITQGLESR